MRFRDRTHAGQVLADLLKKYRDLPNLIVLALPRGGLPVGLEVARALNAPLDVFVVRKLGVPGHEELAMGAIATGGVRVLNEDVVHSLRIPGDTIERAAEREQAELRRREEAYRGSATSPPLAGKTVILVDDGLATGSTMRAAVLAVRLQKPERVIVAVPTGAPETCLSLQSEADEVVCAMTPQLFQAVGLWYERFDQTTDDEVRQALEEARSLARR